MDRRRWTTVPDPRHPIDVLLYLMVPLALVAITIAIAPVLAMTLVDHRLEVRPAEAPLRVADRRDRRRTALRQVDRSDLP